MESKKYLEIIPVEELKDGETPTDIIRERVENRAEAENILQTRKMIPGKKYIARLHTCRHGENGHNQPCSVEILKEIK